MGRRFFAPCGSAVSNNIRRPRRSAPGTPLSTPASASASYRTAAFSAHPRRHRPTCPPRISAARSEGRSLRLLPYRSPPPPANKKPALGRGRVPHTNINNTNNAMAEFPAYCSRYKGRAKQRAGQSPQMSIFVRVNSPLMGSSLTPLSVNLVQQPGQTVSAAQELALHHRGISRHVIV